MPRSAPNSGTRLSMASAPSGVGGCSCHEEPGPIRRHWAHQVSCGAFARPASPAAMAYCWLAATHGPKEFIQPPLYCSGHWSGGAVGAGTPSMCRRQVPVMPREPRQGAGRPLCQHTRLAQVGILVSRPLRAERHAGQFPGNSFRTARHFMECRGNANGRT